MRRAGDVNGDGFDDVLIGAPLYDPNANESPEGAAQLWLGSLSGLSLLHTWIGGEGERYGSALASADVNGDGYSDVILGIPDEGRVGATPGPGRVRVYNGSPTGPDLIADWSEDGPNGSLEFGRAVARAGDVNGDGIDDVLISQGEKPGATFERHGHVSLYFGGEFGLAATPHWTRTGDVVGQQFGSSLTSIGDVNADGFADVAIGSTSTSTGAGNGRVDVYLGNVSGFGAAAVRTWIGGSNNLKLGASIGSAGDVNGDGFSDLVIGVPSSNVLGTAGSAFIHLGDGSGLGENPEVIVTASEPKDSFGEAVAGAGDFNGDGFADLLVGAQFAGPDGSSHGAAYAYYGNEAAGLSREFAQLRTDNAHLSLGGGSTTSGTSFRMHSLLRSAAGRTRVRHELETRTVGEAWGGITTSSNLLDTGAVL
ncbi:MAG: FG-GAP-like repeat-containing protein, partial [Candidatus Eisenbacteria bacterium]